MLPEQPFKPEAVTNVARVAPELDYSNETPDCKTAGQRIAAYVEVGMTLDEVRRLVGKPRSQLPGSWWWSATFSKTGRPIVKFAFGPANGDVPVTGIVSDTSKCETRL